MSSFVLITGQQVVEEVLDAQRPGCPPEYFNISVPTNHTDLNPDGLDDQYIPLLRSRYDMGNTGYSPNSPREQVCFVVMNIVLLLYVLLYYCFILKCIIAMWSHWWNSY